MEKKEILFTLTKKDFEVSWFSPKGPGGQNKNKTQNACRIQHPASGAMATGQEQRDRAQNQKAAIHRLVKNPKFMVWWKRRVWEIDNKKTVEQVVNEALSPENIRVEVMKDGKWVPWDEGVTE